MFDSPGGVPPSDMSTDDEQSTASNAVQNGQVAHVGHMRTFSDEDAFARMNQRAAAQSVVDRRAHDETSTDSKYLRFLEEYKEYCVLVHGDPMEEIHWAVDRVHNYLYYHCYRPRHPPPKQKRKRGEPPPATDRFPKWFDHALFSEVIATLESGNPTNPTPTDLSTKVECIGFEHLNTMKSAMIQHAPTEDVKQAIRLDQRTKNLRNVAKSRKECKLDCANQRKWPTHRNGTFFL